jgi:hypothetical protein
MLLAFGATVAVASLALLLLAPPPPSPPPPPLDPHPWTPTSMADSLSLSKPLVFHSTPAELWPFRARRWGWREVGDALGVRVARVYVSGGATLQYYYDRSRGDADRFGMMAVGDDELQGGASMATVSGPRFVAMVHVPPHRGGAVYYSQLMADLPVAMREAVEPLTAFASGANASETEAILWVGSRGATAQAHYDLSDNFYVQLLGQKTFLLLPPDTEMRVHSSLHKNHRQSRRNMTEDAASLLASTPGAVNVTLSPGQVLYIPPFWYHHVTAESPSASVSVWSPSQAAAAKDNLELLPLPFEATWTRDENKLAVCHLAHGIDPGALQRILRSRHDMDCRGDARANSASSSSIKQRVAQGLPRLREAILSLPPSTRNLVTDDYIEMMAAWSIGRYPNPPPESDPPRELAAMLCECPKS